MKVHGNYLSYSCCTKSVAFALSITYSNLVKLPCLSNNSEKLTALSLRVVGKHCGSINLFSFVCLI